MPLAPAPAHDRIQGIQDAPNWSENLMLQVHDGAAGISVWAHWGRMPQRPGIWEAVLTCYLPGEELLTSRSFGTAPSADSASSGPCGLACIEPLRRWRLTFHGMARRISTRTATADTVADGPCEPLDIELDFQGIHPPWNAGGHLDGSVWASAHLEQAGTIRGRVQRPGTDARVDARGVRDHSYGPRDYSQLRGDTWVSAVTPSGRAAVLLAVWPEEGDPTPMGFTWDGTDLHQATAVTLPPLHSPDGAPHEARVSITTDRGTEELSVAATHRMNYTFDTPVGMILGTGSADDTVVTESPAHITWGDEHADGWFEKSHRLTSRTHGEAL